MHDLEGLLGVLASFVLGLVTNWLSDRRSNRKDERDYVLAENRALSKENTELRKENDKLREELLHHETNNKNH